jgi:hypothetical protein
VHRVAGSAIFLTSAILISRSSLWSVVRNFIQSATEVQLFLIATAHLKKTVRKGQPKPGRLVPKLKTFKSFSTCVIFHTYTVPIWETACSGKIFKFYNYIKKYFSTSKTQCNLCEKMENLYILTMFEKKWGKISYIFVSNF